MKVSELPFIKDKEKYKWLYETLVILGMFLFSIIAYIYLSPLQNFHRNGVVAQAFAWFFILVFVILGVILKIRGKLTRNRLILLLFVVAYFVRLGYMLYTPYNCRQYDTVTNNMDGHEAYAWIIYNTGELPTRNVYQFYHPPLNASLQALWMMVMKPLLGLRNIVSSETIYDINSMHVLYQTTQILALLWMTLTTYFGVKIIKFFKFARESEILAVLFMIFFPRFVQLSAQENNDSLCVMLSFMAIYFTILWVHSKSWLHIIVIAFAIGLAMNTKISGATIAIPVAVFFVLEFIKAIKTKEHLVKIIIQFCVFILICAPIGLWFSIYAGIRFHQPLVYVFNNLNPELSTAQYNVFERFINPFDINGLFGSLYCRAFEDYNLFAYVVKCSIFGEFSYWQGEGFAVSAVIFNYIFIIFSIVMFVFYMTHSKGERKEEKILVIANFATQVISFIYFNISMPYGCTMDFRYIVPIIISFGLGIALTFDKFLLQKGPLGFSSKCLAIVELAFLGSATLFYLVAI